jgi:hypothetical protein
VLFLADKNISFKNTKIGTILQHQIPFQVEKTMRQRRWRRERRRSINILQLFTDRPIIAVK